VYLPRISRVSPVYLPCISLVSDVIHFHQSRFLSISKKFVK
jgi:hypothetical protein